MSEPDGRTPLEVVIGEYAYEVAGFDYADTVLRDQPLDTPIRLEPNPLQQLRLPEELLHVPMRMEGGAMGSLRSATLQGKEMGMRELVKHEKVAESAVVGYPHDITGQGIYAYVTLMAGESGSDELKQELVQMVRTEIGPIAKVNIIQWAPGLPKTRSGKIMRRILRKVAADELDNLGDTSTLADPGVVDNLIENRINR